MERSVFNTFNYVQLCLLHGTHILLASVQLSTIFFTIISRDSTETDTGTVPGRNNVYLVRSRNIFHSRAELREAFSLDN